MKKILLAIAAFLTALAGGYGVNELLGYGNSIQPEITLFTTSTNANYNGVAFVNVSQFDYIGYTVDGVSASGTVRFACSMQETAPTFAATSTSNRWDYVDAVDTATEASIDGWTGVALSGSTVVRQFAVRNSVWKWCGAVLSGNTTPAGLGTSTLYLKRVNNQ